MTSRALPAGLLCAVLALTPALTGVGPRSALPSAGADPAHWGTPIKIMLAGDSITQGFDGDYTWRYRLDRELRRQKVAFDFVGPYKYTYGGANSYRIRTGWDTDHDATGGTRLKNQIDEITSDMATNTPDVVVALYGTTDLLKRPPGDPSPTVPLPEEMQDMRTFVREIREVNGNVDIVLGEVTSRRIPNRVEFNTQLGALAAELSQSTTPEDYFPDSRVVVANLDYPGWDPTKNTYDQTHPTPGGEAIIAQRVAWALKDLGVLPDAPKISGAGLIWNPPWAPSVRASKSRRIVVNWYASWRLYRPQLMRVWVKDLRTRKAGVSGWQYGTQWVSKARKPGRYQVRIQGRRTAMLSPWSRTYTVTVRR